jgi:hypothetical protein
METNPDEQYLPEDKDLLSEVEAIGPASTGTGATTQSNKLIGIQIKAILRNRKTTQDLDASTRKYSFALIAFALAQLTLGVFQFTFEAEYSDHRWVGLVYVFLVVILIAYILGTAIKDMSKK